MTFSNGASLKGLMEAGRDVSVFILPSGKTIESLPSCEVFVKNGQPWVDCAPLLNRKYTAPVPDNALVSRATNPDVGRYGVFVTHESPLGRLVQRLFAARDNYDRMREKAGEN